MNNALSKLFLAALLVTARPSSAAIEPDESRPARPLVLDDGDWDLYGGLRWALSSEPNFGFDDSFAIPLGAHFGVGSDFELKAHVDFRFRPIFQMAISGRVRWGLHDMVAFGLETTLPLGYIEDEQRLGPRAWPLTLELPAFRVEGSAGALQAIAHWTWQIQDGDNDLNLSLDVAGIVKATTNSFVYLELSSVIPGDLSEETLERDPARLAGGFGIGWFFAKMLVGKIHLFTPNLGDFNTWELLCFVVVNTEKPRVKSADDWL